MQQDLSRLTRALQKETCPPRVLDEVERRIAAEGRLRRRWRLAIPLAVAALLLLCGLSVWRWQARENARREAELARSADQARIASQAKDALGLMASVIANAAADSGKIISEQAIPPLRDSLQTAKNKIIEPIQL